LVSTLNGYVHLELMQNRQKSEYLRCYKATYDFYKHHGHIPEIQRLDNETSFVLEEFLRLEQVEVQYVPPGIHRQNPAERAIRHVKNTLIAMCSTTDPTFPAEKLFEDALPQAEIVINCLRPWHPKRSINAWTGMHGKPYDHLAYPMSVYGTKVVVHDKPDARAAWAPHGTDGFYVGPASKHYRCWRCYMPATRSVRITDTIAWLPVAFTMPGHSPLDAMTSAVADLSTALRTLSTDESTLLRDAPAGPASTLSATIQLLRDMFQPTDITPLANTLNVPACQFPQPVVVAPPAPFPQRVVVAPPAP
jgi:hypothetical protein